MATPEQQMETMLANIEQKTGKPLADWLALLTTSGLEKHGQMVKWLKSEHGVTHGFANLISHKAREVGQSEAPSEDLVAIQYAGAKAGLKPIYDHLVELCCSFGDDLELSPKKGYVSLRRNKQFALIKPSTKTRVDLGLQLKGKEPEGKLEASGSFNAMVSHRVRLTSLDDIDEAVVGWLRAAYEAC